MIAAVDSLVAVTTTRIAGRTQGHVRLLLLHTDSTACTASVWSVADLPSSTVSRQVDDGAVPQGALSLARQQARTPRRHFRQQAGKAGEDVCRADQRVALA